MANLRKAVAAEDPANIAYWDRARAKLATKLDRLKGTHVATMADIKTAYRKAGVNIDGTWQTIKTTVQTDSDKAKEDAVGAAQATKAGIDAVNMEASGKGLMTELANGIWAGIPLVSTAANAAAAAAAGPLEAHSPPKEGPLRDIDTWGKGLIDAWVNPMKRQVGNVRGVGAMLAGALAPHPALAAASAQGGGMGRGGYGDTFNVGVLVADDRGLDALDRRMGHRRRLRRRDQGRYNDPR